ncbi:hypothetical protein SELMODRAFT_29398, partial [Selaginella moellendorffii]
VPSRSSSGDDSLWARVSNKVVQSSLYHKSKRALSSASYASKKLMFSTGKAAWIAGTTLLVFVVPLIIEVDKEQQLAELESQQATLLGGAP